MPTVEQKNDWRWRAKVAHASTTKELLERGVRENRQTLVSVGRQRELLVRIKDLENTLRGMVGLVDLLCVRDDLPVQLKDLRDSHRYREAQRVLSYTDPRS